MESHAYSVLILGEILLLKGGDVKIQSTEGQPTLRAQQPVRYDFEEALMKRAYEKKIPILGICIAFQIILEVFGGSLSEDVIG